MFSIHDRETLRDQLIAAAQADVRITAAALVGSAAVGREDEWSDIDLAVRVAEGVGTAEVVEPWTEQMYRLHGAVDHLDVWRGPTLYRVFLLANSLQVDVSFWESRTFGPTGDKFRLVFGEANPSQPTVPADDRALVGTCWLYALHARSSIRRGRHLQALHMINGMRDQLYSLACLRHDLPPDQGRGVDDLPSGVRQALATTMVAELTSPELERAFAAAIEQLLGEAGHIEPRFEEELREPLEVLVRSVTA